MKALGVSALVLSVPLLVPHAATPTCVPFAAGWRDQLNFVVIDREEGRVRLIPNIRLEGAAQDFALVVPTPSFPEMAPVEGDIWNDAAALTAPVAVRDGSNGFLHCQRTTLTPDVAETHVDDSGVTVEDERTIGAFLATILSSDDPNALVDWLNQHGFQMSDTAADLFAPYVSRGWYFTAMKLDTTDPANQLPANGWEAVVKPVLFTFAAARFEVPLPLLSINARPFSRMTFYVVDGRRTDLSGFDTAYANRISSSEYEAIRERYPSLAPFVAPDRFVTRLDRVWRDASEMTESVFVKDAATDGEFRRIVSGGSDRPAGAPPDPALPADLILLALPFAFFRLRDRLGRRR